MNFRFYEAKEFSGLDYGHIKPPDQDLRLAGVSVFLVESIPIKNPATAYFLLRKTLDAEEHSTSLIDDLSRIYKTVKHGRDE